MGCTARGRRLTVAHWDRERLFPPTSPRCSPVAGQLMCPALCLALLCSLTYHACFDPTLTQLAGQKGEMTARFGRLRARQVLRRLISSL